MCEMLGSQLNALLTITKYVDFFHHYNNSISIFLQFIFKQTLVKLCILLDF